MLRATFLGTREELEGAFLDALPRFYPDLSHDFVSVLPPEERAQLLEAYFHRILDPDPAVRGPAARALARYRADSLRDIRQAASGSIRPRRTPRARCPPRRSWKRIISGMIASCRPRDSCWRRPQSLPAIPGLIVQGRYDLRGPPATSHALKAEM